MLSQKSGFYHRLIFKAVVLFTQIACCATYVRVMLAPYQKIFLAWGLLLAVLELFRGFKPWKQRRTLLFCAFLLAYLCTVLFAGKGYLTANLHSFAYMIMMFLVFYAIDAGDPVRRARENAVLANTVILAVFALTVTGLVIAVVIKKWTRYKIGDGEIGLLGFRGKRFTGVVNANIGGALYAVCILLAFYQMIRAGRFRPLRITLYVPVILIETVALILSYSRTAIYALLAVTAFGIFWQLPNRIARLKSSKTAIKTVVRILAAVCVAGGLLMLVNPVRTLLYEEIRAMRKWYKSLSVVQTASLDDAGLRLAAKNTAETETAETAETAEEDLEEVLDDALSSRLTIWKRAGETFLEHPLLGISNEAVEDTLSEKSDFHIWHAHSIYVTVLLASGAAGAVLLTLFTWDGLRNCWKKRMFLWKTQDTVIAGTVVLTAFFLIRELTEATLLFRFSFFSCFMWQLLGTLRQAVEAAPGQEPGGGTAAD